MDEIPSKYIKKCPVCRMKFVGMDLVEWRDNHAGKDCPLAPLPVDVLSLAENEYSTGRGIKIINEEDDE